MRVLIVEDEDAIAEPLAAGLRREGHEVSRVASGRAALEAPEPDLVLLDLRLPDLDGYEVCGHLRARSGVPIIMVTARGEEVDRVVGLELGADDYIVKPFGFRELLARMRAVTRRAENRMDGRQSFRAGVPRSTSGAAQRRSAAVSWPSPPRNSICWRCSPATPVRFRPTADPAGGLGNQLAGGGEDDRRSRRLPAQEARRSRLDRDARGVGCVLRPPRCAGSCSAVSPHALGPRPARNSARLLLRAEPAPRPRRESGAGRGRSRDARRGCPREHRGGGSGTAQDGARWLRALDRGKSRGGRQPRNRELPTRTHPFPAHGTSRPGPSFSIRCEAK